MSYGVEKKMPRVGVNREAGLRHLGWDNASAAAARSIRPRKKKKKKTTALVTTGYPVSIKPNGHSKQTSFSLIAQHMVNISASMEDRHPEIRNYTHGIAFIDLSPNQIHPMHTYYGWSRDKPSLQQFGICLQFGDDRY